MIKNQASFSPQNRHLWWIALLAVSVFFIGLGSWGFFDPDEGRYAEIPREMVVNHDFVTPTLNYFKYFEKPPLLYWTVALAYKVFGFHEWAARLAPALSALLGVFTVYFLGCRMFNPRAGLLGAFVLTTNALWMFLARFLVIDMQVSVLVFEATALWWMGHTEKNPARARLYFLGFWAALALGVLSKGPMTPVLVGATIFIYTALCKKWRSWMQMQWLLGVPLFLLLTAPWFILVAARNPTFNHFFWYEQNIGRFLGTAKVEHVHPVYWFAEALPGLLFPWSFFMFGALWDVRKTWPQISEEKRGALIFLTGGAIFILAFFSASSSKLITYILPMFPLVALLAGAYLDWLARRNENLWRGWFRIAALALSAVLGVAAIAGMTIGGRKLEEIEALPKSYALLLSAVVLAWAAMVLFMTLRRQFKGLMGAVAGGAAATMLALVPIIAAAAPNHIMRPLVNYIRPGLQAGGEIAMFEALSQSTGYYTESRVVMFRRKKEDILGELTEIPLQDQAFTREEEAHWAPFGMEEFKRRMASPQPFYCVVNDHSEAPKVIAQLGDGAQEIIWNKRRSIIGNAAAARLTPQVGGLLSIPGYIARPAKGTS